MCFFTLFWNLFCINSKLFVSIDLVRSSGNFGNNCCSQYSAHVSLAPGVFIDTGYFDSILLGQSGENIYLYKILVSSAISL